jgi:hypothetical protein
MIAGHGRVVDDVGSPCQTLELCSSMVTVLPVSTKTLPF